MIIVDAVINKLLESDSLLGYDTESPAIFQFSKSSRSLLHFDLPPYNEFILIHHIFEEKVNQSDINNARIFKGLVKTVFPGSFVFTRVISHESNKVITNSLSVLGFKKSELSFWYFNESLIFS